MLQCFCRFNKPVIAHQIVAKTKSAQEQLFAFGKFERPTTTRKEGFIWDRKFPSLLSIASSFVVAAALIIFGEHCRCERGLASLDTEICICACNERDTGGIRGELEALKINICTV